MTTMAGRERRRGRAVTGGRPDQPVPTRVDRRRAVAFVTVRLSGVLLAVLALGHFAITHIVHDVADTGSRFVAARWGSALWITWDVLMLVCAFAHGAAGVWVAIADHAPDLRSRRRRQRGLLAVAGAFVLLGLLVVVRVAAR